MRWVVLTDDWPPLSGGVATWSLRVAQGLQASGDSVTVFTRKRPKLATVPGVSVQGVSSRHFARTGAVAMAWAGRKAIQQADAVLATTWPVAWAVAPWLRRQRGQLHVVLHGSDWTRRSHEALARWTLRRSTTWAVSGFLADSARRANLEVKVLPSPVDAEPRPRSLSSQLGHLVMVSRCTELKGGERFVALVNALGARGTVVGDGPLRPAWQAAAGDAITWAGHRSRREVTAILRTADAAVLLPRTDANGRGAEGLGLSLLEAAAVGVPVIGCATGGVPEAVGPGLCLQHPDDAKASAVEVRQWWSPQRGPEQHAWLVNHHGVSRCVQALRAPP